MKNKVNNKVSNKVNNSTKCNILINNQWFDYELVELIKSFGLNKDSLLRALNNKSEQGWGRIKANDNKLYIVSWNTPTIKSIDEQKLDFAKWYNNSYQSIYLEVRKNFKTMSCEDIEDLISDAMLYCVKQIDLGYGINHYLKTMMFKIKHLAIDNYRKYPPNITIVLVENYNKQDESEPDFIEYEIREPQTVLFSSVLEDDSSKEDVEFYDKLTHVELTNDTNAMDNMNNDIKMQVLIMFLSNTFNQSEINVWRTITTTRQTNSKSMKYKEVGLQNGIVNAPMKTVKEICNKVDCFIKDNVDKLKVLYENFKYKSFDEYDLSC